MKISKQDYSSNRSDKQVIEKVKHKQPKKQDETQFNVIVSSKVLNKG